MIDPVHCPIIQNGLTLDFKTYSNRLNAGHCCLRTVFETDISTNVWEDKQFIPLREINDSGKWASGCENCQGLENLGSPSLRTSLLEKYGVEPTLTGPRKLDLLFDINCNLACRSCTPTASTFWQKHLKDNNLWDGPLDYNERSKDVIKVLSNLDLTHLREVTFAGGETLLGKGYWDIAEFIALSVPDSEKNVIINFQSNGTQTILERHYSTIKKFKLIKISFSIDSLQEKFEYLRWPAKWEHVQTNIHNLRDTLPSNVMFNIEETISIFNLYHLKESSSWHKNTFPTNREGDVTNYASHLAGGVFSINAITNEYADSMQNSEYKHLIPNNFQENPAKVQEAIAEIKKFDSLRNQRFEDYFPEVAKFYNRYL